LCGAIVEIVNPFAIPIAVSFLLLKSADRGLRHEPKPSRTWIDVAGMALGVAWTLQSVLQVYTYSQNWVSDYP
jgi:hypothetical protein